MKFAVVYKNEPGVREAVVAILLQAAKQYDLSKQSIRGEFFYTMPAWPNLSELVKISIQLQCEEVEMVQETFKILRQLVIDVEEIT